MTADHVVVPADAIENLLTWLTADDGQKVKQAARALLAQAIPVEQRTVAAFPLTEPGGTFTRKPCWVEVES